MPIFPSTIPRTIGELLHFTSKYLSHVEIELGSRFSAMAQQAVQGLQLLPRTCLNMNVTTVPKTL